MYDVEFVVGYGSAFFVTEVIDREIQEEDV